MKTFNHQFRNATLILLAGWLVSGSAQHALGNSIVNGDFATGDFTGWTVSAIDPDGNPAKPLARVVDLGGGQFAAELSTGEYADGVFISSIEQSFLLTAAEPRLGFKFSLPTITPDPTGNGSSPFSDSLAVSLFDGLSSFTLLLVDEFGATPDPFGTAPGPTSLGPSPNPNFDYEFTADLSSLAGAPITIFLGPRAPGDSSVAVDVSNEDNGKAGTFTLTDITTEESASTKTPDLPSTALLFLIALPALFLFNLEQQRRTMR